MDTATVDAETRLDTYEARVSYYEDGGGRRSMALIFADLERKGIDTGRPMFLHIDRVGGVVIAKQEPWTAG